MIDDWLLSKMQVVPRNDLAVLAEQEPSALPLSRLVQPEYVVLGIEPGTKEQVLAQLVRPLMMQGVLPQDRAFLEGLLRRERIVSTAVGNGIALPHLRNPAENPIQGPAVIVGVCPKGTDFGASDGEKTYLLFIVSTDSEVVHLRIMARLTTLLRDPALVRSLRSARTPEDAIRAILKSEGEAQKERHAPQQAENERRKE